MAIRRGADQADQGVSRGDKVAKGRTRMSGEDSAGQNKLVPRRLPMRRDKKKFNSKANLFFL